MNKTINWISTAFLGFVLVLFSFADTQAQSSVNGKTAVGVWKTVDDETGKDKSHVQIWESGGVYNGKILKLLNRGPGEDQDPSCTKCPGSRANQKVVGMTIIEDMEKSSSKYSGGEILDPKKGKIYTCTMWLEDENTLKVRGWWGMFYRTQTWHRVK